MRLTVALSVLCFALFLVSLLIGPASFSAGQGLSALLFSDGTPVTVVMRDIRLPRALLAAIIGAGLGLSGAAMQGFLRNPLAEPGLIGVSASAALGAVVALQTGFAAAFLFALPFAALIGASVSVLLLLVLAGPGGSSLTLILAGIAISALAGALTTLTLNLSQNPFATSEIVFWMMGSLADRSMSHVGLVLPFIAVGFVILFSLRRGLMALTLGEDTAASMGFRLSRMRATLVFGVALIVGASTAVAGAIGFVGLVVPHILRPFVKGNPGRLLVVSALGGAAMILAADIAVRVILPERDLKLGVLTALIGAPLFLHLILKTRKGYA